MLYKLSIIFYISICNILISVESIEVLTTLGKVKGKLVTDEITGACYYSFEGIPYAKAPVGDHRFMPPVQIEPCPTIIDATKPGYVCPQTELVHSREDMSEDCLNLNIFTPANNSLTKFLPVIFYIHGGKFAYSSGNREPVYGPDFLILNEVVVVAVNYRLGALGFLSMCNQEASGNAGLKDVILALKIVRENIWRFGGDSQKITIMGVEAGAVTAELLMLTKEATGLFQSVILHGGSVLSQEFMQLNPRENALLLGRELGLDCSNDKILLNELKKVDPFDIIKAQEAILRKDPQRGFREFRPFKPVVEIECENAVLTRPPLELIREGAICDVPIMIGFNDQEGVEMFPFLEREPELIDRLNENCDLLIPEDIKYPYGSLARKNLANCIREFYFNGTDISFTKVQNYVNLISDTRYTFSIDYLVQLFKDKKKSPVYYYIFGADTELNIFKILFNITYPGAAHSDNIGYIFLALLTKPRYQCLDKATKRIQTNVLLNLKNFVYNGCPDQNVNFWPETGPNRYHIFRDYEVTPIFRSPLPKRIRFWRSVYENYYNSKYDTANFCCNR